MSASAAGEADGSEAADLSLPAANLAACTDGASSARSADERKCAMRVMKSESAGMLSAPIPPGSRTSAMAISVSQAMVLLLSLSLASAMQANAHSPAASSPPASSSPSCSSKGRHCQWGISALVTTAGTGGVPPLIPLHVATSLLCSLPGCLLVAHADVAASPRVPPS